MVHIRSETRRYNAPWRSLAAGLAAAATVLVGGMAGPVEAQGQQPAVRASAEAIRRAAADGSERRIVISIKDKRLWLLEGRDTLMSAAVAVGMNSGFTYNNRRFHFATPQGRHRVLAKETEPVWVPPDWHYYEKAKARGLEAVHLKPGDKYELSDGSFIEVRGDQVGRTNQFGNFWPWTPGMELIFDGKIFIPPIRSAQRRIPDALGGHKLALGDGYMIHGTHVYNEDSIGTAASHGCVRMRNDDVEKLYGMVRVGVPVYIY
jgi:hypothetical protein